MLCAAHNLKVVKIIQYEKQENNIKKKKTKQNKTKDVTVFQSTDFRTEQMD